jgi:glycosyltransferase involved in cell wall biosynthesis
MAKLLLITTAYLPPPSAGAARTIKLLKWLPQQGWDVTLLTLCWEGMPDDLERLPGDPENIYRVPWKSWRVHRLAAKVDALATTPTGKSGGCKSPNVIVKRLRRLASEICQNVFEFPDVCHAWIKPAVQKGMSLALKTDFDLIYSSSGTGVSAHFIASELQARLKIPWIHEYRDLWAGNPWRDTKIYFWRNWRERAWERRFLRQADRAIVMNHSNVDNLASRVREDVRGKIAVVPNGFDADEFPENRNYPKGLPLKICYTGSLYHGKRDIRGLFEAIRLVIDQGDAAVSDFQFCYAGSSSSDVDHWAQHFGITSIVCDCKKVSCQQAKQMQVDAQILLIVEACDDDPWIKDNVPTKLFEYLAAGRKILALAHPAGGIAEIISETRTGTTIAPYNINEVAAFLKENVHALRQTNDVMYMPDKAAIQRHSWHARSRVLAGLLDQVKASTSANQA